MAALKTTMAGVGLMTSLSPEWTEHAGFSFVLVKAEQLRRRRLKFCAKVKEMLEGVRGGV